MRFLALVDRLDHVCCRYRVRPLESIITSSGGALHYRELARSRGWLSHGWPRADVVITQRGRFSWFRWQYFRRRYPHLIYDFDDALWLRDSYSPKGLISTRRLRRFQRAIRFSDWVVAGNSFLAEQAVRFTSPDRVQVIPTCVDPDKYQLAKHEREGRKLRLAWIGSASTLHGLEQVADLLDTIGREFPGSTLVLICDRPLQLSSLQIEFHTWNPVDEATWLASADIGISWLPDDDWSRGKCGLKLLQYMAAGLPVLANPVGVQREMVLHGQNGYLVESPDDWLQAIACLGNSASLRQRMGQAAREWVEARYSFQTMRGAWRRLLNRLDVVRAT